jgi:flagellin
MQLGSVFQSTAQLLSRSLTEKTSFDSLFKNRSSDAVTTALSAKLIAEIGVLRQGSNNLSYGESAVNIAGAAMMDISNINSRMIELATQSSNRLLSDDQRASINQEFQALAEEANRMTNNTEFNGQSLFNSSGFSIGSGSGQAIEVSLGSYPSFAGLSVSTQSDAATTINSLLANQGTINSSFSKIGASSSSLSTQRSSNDSQIATKFGALENISGTDLLSSISTANERDFKRTYLALLKQKVSDGSTFVNTFV